MIAKLDDIAVRAKLSRQTVARILAGQNKENRPSSVSRSAKVRRIARELRYHPNAAAKSVSTGRFGAAAMILSTDGIRSILPDGLLAGVQRSLSELDMHLVVASLPDATLSNDDYVPKILRVLMADGLLVNFNAGIPPRMVELIHNFAVPSIWINSKQDQDCVYPDDFGAAQHATRRFLELGHRRIIYLDFSHELDSRPLHYSGVDRYEGYAQTMAASGLQPRRYGSAEMRDEIGVVAAIKHLLTGDGRPTAIITYGMLEARAAVAAAMVLGMELPRDMSLIAFTIDSTNDLGPHITAMHIPEVEIGMAAVGMLNAKINNPAEVFPPRIIPFDFVPGQTWGPAPKPLDL